MRKASPKRRVTSARGLALPSPLDQLSLKQITAVARAINILAVNRSRDYDPGAGPDRRRRQVLDDLRLLVDTIEFPKTRARRVEVGDVVVADTIAAVVVAKLGLSLVVWNGNGFNTAHLDAVDCILRPATVQERADAIGALKLASTTTDVNGVPLRAGDLVFDKDDPSVDRVVAVIAGYVFAHGIAGNWHGLTFAISAAFLVRLDVGEVDDGLPEEIKILSEPAPPATATAIVTQPVLSGGEL